MTAVRKLLNEIERELGMPDCDLNLLISKVFRPKKIHKNKAVFILKCANILTLGQLLEKSEEQILSHTNMGVITLNYIKEELAYLGLKLKD